MTNYTVSEGNEYAEIQDLLNDPKVQFDDTITLETNNQQGYKKWKVIKKIIRVNGNKKREKVIKDIEVIDSYDRQMDRLYDNYGGKRKSNKRKAHRKRKTHRRSRK